MRRPSFKTRPLERYSKISLGVVALVAVMLVVAAVVVTGNLGLGTQSYTAEFLQAAQIRPGDDVTVAGISVGSVEGARLDSDHVLVTMRIDDDVAIGADTLAAIKLTTLLGSRYIELQPAGDVALPDRRIPLSNTSVPYDLQAALRDATTTFEQVDTKRIGESMTLLAQQLEGTPALVPQLLGNIGALSEVVADRRDEIGSLLAGTDRIAGLIRSQQGDLGALIVQGRELLLELLNRRAALTGLFDSTTRLVHALHEVVVDDQPQVDQMLGELAELSGLIARHDDLLRNIFQILPVPFRNIANASGTANDIDLNAPAGPLVDAWMCAVSGRAQQLNLPEYLQDCQ
ncbi:MCE family protein [Antrihabitans sp. YC2-6]|uniref:MCE family protein n=1 Tax=Antrihabitans sp. YC2-6 TaxID=2799498 RepID=UPI0018F2CE59|nr:MCE family protein [Antrihabitans sp. YC2-6]MBJ8347229.1 MCE family protein [Antrihabitans sp. YC2-6]